MVTGVQKNIGFDLGSWEMIIGLEVHAQIKSCAKLFSNSPATFGGKPNSHISPFDVAMPGMLPVINLAAIEMTVLTGLALNAQINSYSVFDRKHYFYADLPQGYQISQHKYPIANKGSISITLENGIKKLIGIERLHLEQDAGKLLHDQHAKYSFIDLNRSGIPLIEIVSCPDMKSAYEATAYVRKLANILDYIGTCDVNMAQGSLRIDINLSLHHPGETLGTRTEIKNLNSLKSIRQAIEVEAMRQKHLLELNKKVIQETLLFDTERKEIRVMRSKENVHDYRYFPDPDLLPLEFTTHWVETISASLPELPDQKIARFCNDMGLDIYESEILVADKYAASYFETLCKTSNPIIAANWIIVEVFGRLNKFNLSIAECPVSANNLAELLELLSTKVINGRLAKEILDIMFQTKQTASEVIKDRNLIQISDNKQITALIEQIITNNIDLVKNYHNGNNRLFSWFIGQVMISTQGKANPSTVNQILKQKLYDVRNQVLDDINQ